MEYIAHRLNKKKKRNKRKERQKNAREKLREPGLTQEGIHFSLFTIFSLLLRPLSLFLRLRLTSLGFYKIPFGHIDIAGREYPAIFSRQNIRLYAVFDRIPIRDIDTRALLRGPIPVAA